MILWFEYITSTRIRVSETSLEVDEAHETSLRYFLPCIIGTFAQGSGRKVHEGVFREQVTKLYMMLAITLGFVFLVMNFVLILTKVWLDT